MTKTTAMTLTQAREIAEFVWSEGNAIGVIQRGITIGYAVGRCYVDGRKAEVKGSSRVDWESAFLAAAGDDASTTARINEAFARWRIAQ